LLLLQLAQYSNYALVFHTMHGAINMTLPNSTCLTTKNSLLPMLLLSLLPLPPLPCCCCHDNFLLPPIAAAVTAV
jgi:hypothetical protein